MGRPCRTTLKTQDMLDDKVFKFPDGNGGYTLKVMSPDGQWHDCDENGNYTDQMPSEDEPAVKPRRKASAKEESKGSAEGKELYKFTVVAPQKTGQLISDYAAWKSFHEHRNISRSDIILKAVLGVIKRDSEFSDFYKKYSK